MNAPRAQTLTGALLHAAARATPGVGVTYIDRLEQETHHSWPEVIQRMRAAAGALFDAGVRQGDRVVIILPTGPEFLDAFFGCQYLGAVPVPLYPPVRLGRMNTYIDRTASMMARSEAVLLITEKRIRRIMGQVLARFRPKLGTLDAKKLQNGTPAEQGLWDPDALALIQFSSGTTVHPKPVGLTHRQVLANIDALLEFVPYSSERLHTGVCWLPLYHDMGLIGCLITAALRPGHLVLIPPEVFLIQPAVWLRAISRHKGTISPAPNFAYSLCAERIKDTELAGVDLSSWQYALNGAEPVAPSSLRAFQERFAPWGLRPEALTPVYGLAESCLAVTFSDASRPFITRRIDASALQTGHVIPNEDGVEVVSVGTPVLGCSIEIRDEAQQTLPERRVGTIWTQSPSVMGGYIDRKEQPIIDGWLDTGDLGFLLDGELYITGRKKDIIIIRGKNHSPHDIEQAVNDLPAVRTGCAAAFSTLKDGKEALVLLVEVRQEHPDLHVEIRRAVRQSVGLTLDHVDTLTPGTLPRTSSGKIRRAEARRLWQEAQLNAPQSVTPRLVAETFAKSAIGHIKSRLNPIKDNPHE